MRDRGRDGLLLLALENIQDCQGIGLNRGCEIRMSLGSNVGNQGDLVLVGHSRVALGCQDAVSQCAGCVFPNSLINSI